MSRIIDVRINWMDGWNNHPRFEVLFDQLPSRDELRYDQRNTSYLAIHESGYASFFSWSGRGNDGGYGGHEFTVTTSDESQKLIRGPWSSNSESINRDFNRILVTEALVTDNPGVWALGYTFTSGAVSVESLIRFLDKNPRDFGLALIDTGTGVYVLPTRHIDGSNQPKDGKILYQYVE